MHAMPAALSQKGPPARRLGAAGVALLAAAAALAAGSAACAQSASGSASSFGSSSASDFGSSTASQFRNGFNARGAGEFEGAIDVSTRDANGNKVFVDGVTQVPSDQSVFSRQSVGGAFDSFAGAGAIGGSSMFGNTLNATMPGSFGTFVLSRSQQSTTSDSSDTSVLNGKVNLDGR